MHIVSGYVVSAAAANSHLCITANVLPAPVSHLHGIDSPFVPISSFLPVDVVDPQLRGCSRPSPHRGRATRGSLAAAKLKGLLATDGMCGPSHGLEVAKHASQLPGARETARPLEPAQHEHSNLLAKAPPHTTSLLAKAALWHLYSPKRPHTRTSLLAQAALWRLYSPKRPQGRLAFS